MASPFSRTAPVEVTPEGRRRQERRQRQRRDQRLVLAVVALSALMAASAPAAPTGNRLADALWCGALAAAVSWAASRSRRWAWLWSAAIVTFASVGSWWGLCGLLALALACVGAFVSLRNRILGAAIGALVVQAALRLPAFGFFGLPSLLAAIAVVPLLASGYERATPAAQKRVRWGIGIAVLFVFLATAGATVAAVLARQHLDQAVTNACSGLALIRQGQPADAAVKLDLASDGFSASRTSLDAVWTWPARAVPIVAEHRDALAEASRAGDRIARTGSVAADTAPYQDLKTTGGQVNLALVTSMQAPVGDTLRSLEAARSTLKVVRSGWLIGAVADPLRDFSDEVDLALPQAELAHESLDAAPALLGAGGDRHYLVLFTNPAESRFIGGFTGSYGLLTAHDGKVSFTNHARISSFLPPGANVAPLTPQSSGLGRDQLAEYLARYRRYDPLHNYQNLTVSPDLPTDAKIARAIYHDGTGIDVDGVVVVDPYGLAALLQLTGPVPVTGLPYPLDANDAASYLISGQYLTYGNDKDDRKDVLDAAASATFDALTSRDLPGPQHVGDALGPAVQQGRLRFYSFVPGTQPLFERLGTTGRFAPDPHQDYLSVRSANANPNKIDAYLHRGISYDASYDPGTGFVKSTATITLRNSAPGGGLPPYVIGNDFVPPKPPGSNTMYLSVYSPLSVTKTTLDGAPSGVEPELEAGGNVYSMLVTVDPGQTRTIVLHLEGTLPMGRNYRLGVLNQPTVYPDQLALRVASGSRVWHIGRSAGLLDDHGTATWRGPLSRDERFGADFRG